jgi:ATP-dependent Lhr-like helicase
MGKAHMDLDAFDPLVAQWFAQRFRIITEPQQLGWPIIRSGRDVLISAPTGSGKTLAAFLLCLDRLVREARTGSLAPCTQVVYVSPLKALSNDVHKNLETPLEEIRALALSQGVLLAPIRTAVRTGDTSAADRQQMTREPPHILVTTPESLYLMLTAERSRAGLRHVSTFIVDEIHALAGNKRGTHLALSLERLERLVCSSNGNARPQRIGLSATVNPLEEVGKFLAPEPETVEVAYRREMDLAIEIPNDELSHVATNEMWTEIYDRIARLILDHRTTLVFVNTRRLAERVTHHLVERLGDNAVMTHHGSLSRTLRLQAEQRLKSGELRAVVATASLELGIDIGSVELVCQIGSPRSIAVSLQRFGRAGHWVGAIPKARLFATTRDELIESIAVLRAIRRGMLDRTEIPAAPLDILAQQIVAAAACEDWHEDELYDFARRAFPYRALNRRDFDDVIEMLSEGIAGARGRSGAYLHRDRVNHRLRARRGARLAAITSGGAIPDNANYLVVAEPDEVTVGTVDEDFAVESMAGDVFLLGTTSWRIRRVEAGRVRVEDAHGAAPTIPFWRGEAPGRTFELSREVSMTRANIEEAAREAGLGISAAAQAIAYVRAGVQTLGSLPTQQTVVAERFFDESGGMQLVIHAPFGNRVTRAWGLALRKRFCRTFNFELQAAATDNGLLISLSEQHAFPLEIIFDFLKPETVGDVLSQALLAAPMFTARWRWNASRALAVLRFSGGRRVPPPIQRMRSDDLIAAVFPDQAACAENLTGEIRIPDHPLVKETMDNCLHEAMDLDGLRRLLEEIRSGRVHTVSIDTAQPSVFSHEILNSNPFAYLDDAPLEERRARAVQLRSSLREEDAAGLLDPEAILEVARDAWPVVRDPDELHDALLSLIALPPVPEWEPHYRALVADRRATALGGLWVCAERLEQARAIYRDAELRPAIAAAGAWSGSREEAVSTMLRGWFESLGPTTAASLASRLSLSRDEVEIALSQLEGQGLILRGRFSTRGGENEIEWCHRRLLARIHRLTLGRLRREIEPASTTDFLRFLARWQHASPGAQLHGLDGLLQVVRQLQGYELPASAWESSILPTRVANYSPELLDQLCLSGEVMWGRISPHPAFERLEPKRVRPTSVAPITLFVREDAEWLLATPPNDHPSLSHPASDTMAAIDRYGASFFSDLVKRTGRLPSEVEDGLWELVTAGLVTADGFDNLRSLIDPKRRRGEGHARTARPRHAPGRWARIEFASSDQDTTEVMARQLLRRWGVLFRDILRREPLAPAWRDLVVSLRRMEARGEIRGGRFLSAFIGEQYAMPEAVDLLRAMRRQPVADPPADLAPVDPIAIHSRSFAA